MAENCGFCLELPEKYHCGWCQDQCDVQEKCVERNNQYMWLNKQQTCPDPQITDFDPRSGPIEGGTNVTISGINLGRSFDDIMTGVHVVHEQNGVTVGHISCRPFREKYVRTSKITCQLQAPNSSLTAASPKSLIGAPVSGPFVVKVQNDYTAKSRDFFSFVSPKITHIEPSKGPKSGGTRLNIWGLHMDAGSNFEAYLGPLPCILIKRDRNRAECITTGRYIQGEEKVRVRFDNAIRTFDDYKYLYVEDPKITTVESGVKSGVLRGITSGGQLVSVKGSNLNSVQKPMMYIEVRGVNYNSSCQVESASEMKCRTPRVSTEQVTPLYPDSESGDPLELNFGFIMDDVKSVQDLTRRSNPFSKFQLYPDPVYHSFGEPDGIKYYKADYYLTINVSIFPSCILVAADAPSCP